MGAGDLWATLCGMGFASSAPCRGGSGDAFTSPDITLGSRGMKALPITGGHHSLYPCGRLLLLKQYACDQQEVPVGYAPDVSTITITIHKKHFWGNPKTF